MTGWEREVAAARDDVLRELDPLTRDILEPVPVLARDRSRGWPMWAAYFPRRHEIELYRVAFDNMPDPENRAVQIRDCIRHEYAHALGEHFDENAPRVTTSQPPGWTGRGEFRYEKDGLVITLPAAVR